MFEIWRGKETHAISRFGVAKRLMQCTLYSSERDPAQDEKRPSIMTRSIRYRGSSPQHPYAVGHENSCPTAAASPPDITVVVLRLRGCCLFAALVISGFYWYTADGQILHAHQDKKGALAISPPIVLLAGKHGISHNSLILSPDVAVVWIVSESSQVN